LIDVGSESTLSGVRRIVLDRRQRSAFRAGSGGCMSTPDLLVRPAVEADVPSMMAIYNHYVETSPATFDIEPVSLENRLSWFRSFGTSGPFRLVVAERAGRVIGYAGSGKFREKAAYATSVEMTVYVHPEARGLGVGVAMYERLFAILAAEPIHRAYAGITRPNPASVKLHRRFGFRDIGTYDEVGFKLGQYWSVQWLQKVMPH
jgi:phosphinothricin acetyltransferase